MRDHVTPGVTLAPTTMWSVWETQSLALVRGGQERERYGRDRTGGEERERTTHGRTGHRER